MNNQEEDLFEQALIDLEEESETSAEPIDGTIEERIEITEECLRSITLEQLRGISHRYVSDATLQAAMSSTMEDPTVCCVSLQSNGEE